MNKMKAIFLNNGPRVPEVYAKEQMDRLTAIADIKEEVITLEALLAANGKYADTEAIFTTWGMPVMTEDQIKEHLPNLKYLFYGAGTVQAFARPFLDCGVTVCSAWVANGVPVAEYAHAQILLANKGFFTVCRKGGGPDLRAEKKRYIGNYNVRVGLLGAGVIGRMVIEKLKANKVEVYVFDPFMSEEKAKELGVVKSDLETIFATCDTISNHLANKKEIEKILSRELFALMKPTACFINTGRGAQVDEEGLIDALKAEPLRSAVLDVTWPEPPAEDSPFFSLPNVYWTPHIAGSSGREVERLAQYMIDEYERVLNGEELLYSVSYQMLATMA
ncbi:MAG: hydroxyacid dehydrogenase [Clostridiales bacterium]|nr:hydroxyacid dehydrogenase [Clostridiales bacterium]